MFSGNELSKSIQDAINQGHVTIPDGHTAALVIHGDTDTKAVTVAYVEKIGTDWQIMGYGSSSLVNKDFKAGFNVEWSK